MKLKSRLMAGSLLILLSLISCTSNQLTLYVSKDGNDNNRGTKHKPLESFQGALNKIEELRVPGEKGYTNIVIYFREGLYEVKKTLVLNEGYSENLQYFLKIKSYKNEKVIFSGGIRKPSSIFQSVEDVTVLSKIIDDKARANLVKVELKAMGIENYGKIRQHGFSIAIHPAPMELFINDIPMIIARYPNNDLIPVPEVVSDCSWAIEGDFSNKPGIISYNNKRINDWIKAEEIWLRGYFKTGYADDNLNIASIDTLDQNIKFKQAHMFGLGKTDSSVYGRNIGYYAYNLMEEIDMPGEYYIDRKNGILYLYPPKNFENASITLSMLRDPILAIENTSNITISGITFQHGRGMGIYLENAKNVTIRNCDINNFGTVGVMFGKGVTGADYPVHEFSGFLKSRVIGNLKAHVYENAGFNNNAGENCSIINSKIHHTGTGGIILSGGDRRTLHPGNNSVINCEIHDFNRWNKSYCPGIAIYGVKNRVSNCYIHDAPHQGIAVFGNDHLIDYTRFEALLKDVNDNAAIYMGRDLSERGIVIRHNFFVNLGQKDYENGAIKLDDLASGVLIEGNVFYNASKSGFADIMINGGNENVIRNNVFINSAHVLWLENPNMSVTENVFKERYGLHGLLKRRLFLDININHPAWKKKYPELERYNKINSLPILRDNHFYKNIIITSDLITSKHELDTTIFTLFYDNYAINKNDKSISWIKKLNNTDTIDLSQTIQDFYPIPFHAIGLKQY